MHRECFLRASYQQASPVHTRTVAICDHGGETGCCCHDRSSRRAHVLPLASYGHHLAIQFIFQHRLARLSCGKACREVLHSHSQDMLLPDCRRVQWAICEQLKCGYSARGSCQHHLQAQPDHQHNITHIRLKFESSDKLVSGSSSGEDVVSRRQRCGGCYTCGSIINATLPDRARGTTYQMTEQSWRKMYLECGSNAYTLPDELDQP
jgi:hypothetical protein